MPEQKDKKNEQEEQDKRLKENMSAINHIIMVMSGKGGVGKTTVAVNLAMGLAEMDYQVGILDVDIHGPNVAKMLGIEKYRLTGSEQNGIDPAEPLPNLKAVSLALAGYERDTPFIWRGPLKMGVIKQFLGDVQWGPLDYLIIDSPPGTGDEPLSVCQLIPSMTGSIVVTTPQEVAILDSRKSITFSKQLNIPVLGVVENMSGYVCPHCGKEVDLFGTGGGEKAAEEMEVPFLGRIPIESAIVKAGDQGRPYIVNKETSPSGDAIRGILDKIVAELNTATT
jgi:ATP-binding protein involved in chromosome partitioning